MCPEQRFEAIHSEMAFFFRRDGYTLTVARDSTLWFTLAPDAFLLKFTMLNVNRRSDY
jgi:hypothetical protein